MPDPPIYSPAAASLIAERRVLNLTMPPGMGVATPPPAAGSQSARRSRESRDGDAARSSRSSRDVYHLEAGASADPSEADKAAEVSPHGGGSHEQSFTRAHERRGSCSTRRGSCTRLGMTDQMPDLSLLAARGGAKPDWPSIKRMSHERWSHDAPHAAPPPPASPPGTIDETLAPRSAASAPASGMSWRETQLLSQLAQLTHERAADQQLISKLTQRAELLPPDLRAELLRMAGREAHGHETGSNPYPPHDYPPHFGGGEAGMPVPLPLDAQPPARGPSTSDDARTSPLVSSLVGDFHDRFWLPRDAAGDAAAASAASIAAMSSDPGQRSVAAHLYAVRTTQRLVQQATLTVRHQLAKPSLTCLLLTPPHTSSSHLLSLLLTPP